MRRLDQTTPHSFHRLITEQNNICTALNVIISFIITPNWSKEDSDITVATHKNVRQQHFGLFLCFESLEALVSLLWFLLFLQIHIEMPLLNRDLVEPRGA